MSGQANNIICLTELDVRNRMKRVNFFGKKRQRKLGKGQSRMDNPEIVNIGIKNGQSRDRQHWHQEWTIQRQATLASRNDNPEIGNIGIKN